MKFISRFKSIFILIACLCSLYGLSRLYYAVTGGFTISNITSELSYDPKWSTHELSSIEKSEIDKALDQKYSYLGKGCQAYVFGSDDGRFVIKFFKYQRFRPQSWLNTLTFIPAVDRYQQHKVKEKKAKLDNVFRSWKVAFEELSPETGIAYVHLNKSADLNKQMTIRDKMGFEHQIDLDQMEFLVQHKADMLCPTLEKMMSNNDLDQAKKIIDRLITMLLSEYERGYADNDHALMQNTGVWQGNPIHIDVGQFIYNDKVRDPKIFHSELFDKTYKFHLWLKERNEILASYLEDKLVAIMGEEYYFKGPYIHKSDVAKIPHQDQ